MVNFSSGFGDHPWRPASDISEKSKRRAKMTGKIKRQCKQSSGQDGPFNTDIGCIFTPITKEAISLNF